MTTRVSLRELLDGMQWQTDEMTAYLNIKTGQVVPVSDDELEAADLGETWSDRPDWEIKALEVAREVLAGGDDYIPLPDLFDVDEYRMLERFANRVADPEAGDRLRRATQGRGAFRRFKDAVHDLGLAQEWYDFRDREYEKAAIEWCEAHGVEYTRDQPDAPG